MSSIRWVVCLVWFAATSTTFGDTPAWKETLNAGIAQYTAGHLAEAETLLRGALEAARRDMGSIEIAETLEHVADVYLSEERFKDAEAAYSEAVSLYKQSSSVEIGGIVALRGLGTALTFEGRDHKAVSVLNEALREAKTNFKSDTHLNAVILTSLGLVYIRQHSFKKAEALFHEIIQTQSGDRGDDLLMSIALNNLALIHREERKYTDAEKEYQKCLRITEDHLGTSHPGIGLIHGSLGLLYLRAGRLNDAETEVLESLRITTQTSPLIPGRLVRVLHMLGEIYRRQGKLGESEDVLARAVQIARQKLNHDPEIIAVLDAYSDTLKRSGKTESARNAHREAELLRLEKALTVPINGLQ
jgi:tetratricopeptide (TPR) repeat protein